MLFVRADNNGDPAGGVLSLSQEHHVYRDTQGWSSSES